MEFSMMLYHSIKSIHVRSESNCFTKSFFLLLCQIMHNYYYIYCEWKGIFFFFFCALYSSTIQFFSTYFFYFKLICVLFDYSSQVIKIKWKIALKMYNFSIHVRAMAINRMFLFYIVYSIRTSVAYYFL